jgi:hypothetical protein
LVITLVSSAAGAEPFPSSGITATLRFFMERDSNGDNRMSEREYVGDKGGRSRTQARRDFRRMDDDNDGWLSLKEYSDSSKRYSMKPGR